MSFNAARAAPLPEKYRNVRLFLTEESYSNPSESQKPYNACDEYSKKIKYYTKGTMAITFGEFSYAFDLKHLAQEAANEWNRKLQDVGCQMKIIPSEPFNANFRIVNDPDVHQSPVRTYLKGIPSIFGSIQPGVYFNPKYPYFVNKDNSNEIRRYFIAGTTDRDIAYAIAYLVALHEFGHALGLAHPFEFIPDLETTMLHNRQILQWTNQEGYAVAPVMIPTTVDYFYRLSTTLDRPISISDITISPPELAILGKIARCSNSLSRARRSAPENTEECKAFIETMQIVSPYPGENMVPIQFTLLGQNL